MEIRNFAAAALAAIVLSTTTVLPAHATGEVVGNAALEAAYTLTEQMLATNLADVTYTDDGGSYSILINPASTNPPATALATSSYDGKSWLMAPTQNQLDSGSPSIAAQSMFMIQPLVFPEAYKTVLGAPRPNVSGDTNLTSFDVTATDANNYTLVIKEDNSSVPDSLAAQGPIFNSTKVDFTLEAGHITSAIFVFSRATLSDMSDAAVIGSGSLVIDFNAETVNSAWSAAYANWLNVSIHPSAMKLVKNLTSAFAASITAAKRKGVTVVNSAKGNHSVSTYSASSHTSIDLAKSDKNKTIGATFDASNASFAQAWITIFGQGQTYGKGSVSYKASSRTYTLSNLNGSHFQVVLDKKGLITSYTLSQYAALSQAGVKAKVSYAPDKTTFKTWGGLNAKEKVLVRFLTTSTSGYLSGQGVYEFTLTGAQLNASFRQLGSATFQSIGSTDTTGIDAAKVKALAKLLGIKVS